jgi:hypothetical protein
MTAINTMSSSSLVMGLAFCGMTAGAAHAATVRCPPSITINGHRHPLADADLFDGPPAQLASLIPVNGRWDLASIRGAAGDFFLVCKFKDAAATRTVAVPKAATVCAIQGTSMIAVSCH